MLYTSKVILQRIKFWVWKNCKEWRQCLFKKQILSWAKQNNLCLVHISTKTTWKKTIVRFRIHIEREAKEIYRAKKGEACIHSGHSSLKMSLQFIWIWTTLSKPWRNSYPFSRSGWLKTWSDSMPDTEWNIKTQFDCQGQPRRSDSLRKLTRWHEDVWFVGFVYFYFGFSPGMLQETMSVIL